MPRYQIPVVEKTTTVTTYEFEAPSSQHAAVQLGVAQATEQLPEPVAKRVESHSITVLKPVLVKNELPDPPSEPEEEHDPRPGPRS